MSEWQEMATAPRDGTQILVCRNNDVFWEYDVVRWSGRDPDYPWATDYNAYPEGRLDYWRPLEPPYKYPWWPE